MLIDKPAGPTSHDVVARLRRVLGTRAVGHAGTLDPFATGLLLILVGPATRLARFIERLPKGYRATAVLGRSTDTDDVTGRVVEEVRPPVWPGEALVRQALASLVGTRPQRPPAYSARRVEGRRGYQLARAGQAVELPARDVSVYGMELLRYQPPVVEFRAAVSAGTYIRALARDLGGLLGTVAHCGTLRREWIGNFRVEEAADPEEIRGETRLLPPLELLEGMPRLDLDAEAATLVRRGRTLPALEGTSAETALVHQGRLIGVAERIDQRWQPRIVLEPV